MKFSFNITPMHNIVQKFFFWQTVYAQNSIAKPELVVDNTIPVLKPDIVTDNTIPVDILRSPDNNTNVSQLKPAWVVTPTPTASTEIKTPLSTACTQQWNVWNTNNANPEGACFETCPNGYVQSEGLDVNECIINNAGDLGVQCSPDQLRNGTCSWNINKTLWIRLSDTTPNPTLLLQDIILSATSFIGTLMVIALIVMGMKYVQWWFDEGSTGDLKGNIKKLLIGLFLVIWSYTIIRIIQYVARWY